MTQHWAEGADSEGLEREHLSMERERLRFERQKLAIEIRLKRQEFAARKGKSWLEVLANPLTLAIVGGFVTLMTTIVTNYLTQQSNAATEKLRAELARESAQQQLQADLIKKFVEGPETKAVRENLRFLVDAGLLPAYADNIKAYLYANPGAAPQVGAGPAIGGIVGADERVNFSSTDPNTQARFEGVGRILGVSSQGTKFSCTGFLVSPEVLVTARHCLEVEWLGAGEALASASFEPLDVSSPKDSAPQQIPIDLTRLVIVELPSSGDFRYFGAAVVAIKAPTSKRHPYLVLDSKPPSVGLSFEMVFFPMDRDTWVYSAGPDCRVMAVQERELQHLCDTGGGASGSALVSAEGTVMGVQSGIGPVAKRAVRADVIRNDPNVLRVFGQLPTR